MENLVHSVVAYSAVHLLAFEELFKFLRNFAPFSHSGNAHWADILCASSYAFLYYNRLKRIPIEGTEFIQMY
jgi:hypothetical protein